MMDGVLPPLSLDSEAGCSGPLQSPLTSHLGPCRPNAIEGPARGPWEERGRGVGFLPVQISSAYTRDPFCAHLFFLGQIIIRFGEIV